MRLLPNRALHRMAVRAAADRRFDLTMDEAALPESVCTRPHSCAPLARGGIVHGCVPQESGRCRTARGTT
jgi:hypothetical protein